MTENIEAIETIIEEAVAEVLVENPEIITEAITEALAEIQAIEIDIPLQAETSIE